MTSSSQVIVESFHINVGLGDSAIHVVCTETCTETEDGSEITRVFDRAVFIDGGKGSDGAVQSIVDTIEQLEERYGLAAQNKKLQFISIIITHWDDDHWKGIDSLLQREENLINDNGRYQRFLYDNNAYTTVYAPDANEKGNLIVKKASLGSGPVFQYKGHDLAKAMVGPDIIGYDFFTNTKPAGTTARQAIKDVDVLVGNNTGPVGMYCVASDLAVVGLRERPRRTNKTAELIESLFTLLPTPTNRQSIAAIIVWTANKHISHYFAGDLDFWGEALLTKWLKASLKPNTTPWGITCVKSSHHGAKNSNPPTLFFHTRPKRVIFSSSTHYGHPAWETLCMLYAYHSYMKHTYPSFKIPNLCLLTCFPYWLAGMHKRFDAFPHQNINIDPFRAKSERDKLSKARQGAAKHLLGVYKKIDDEFPGESGGEALVDIMHSECEYDGAKTDEMIFESISRVFVREASSLFDDLWTFSMDTGAATDGVLYVWLRLTSDPETDGHAALARRGLQLEDDDPPAPLEFIELDLLENEDKKKDSLQKKSISKSGILQQASASAGKADKSPEDGRRRTSERLRLKKEGQHPKLPQGKNLKKRDQGDGFYNDIQGFETASLSDLMSINTVKMMAISTTQPGAPASDLTSSVSAAATVQFPYSILSSSYATAAPEQIRSLEHTVLLTDDWLDDFVLTLQTSAIRLAKPLEADGWTPFHQMDELAGWVGAAFRGSTMDIHADGPELRITTPYGLVFRTSTAAAALGTKAGISLDGLSSWTENGTLHLGLDPECRPTETSWTTSEVVGMFPTDPKSAPDPAVLVPAMAVEALFGLKWKMDPSKSAGQRNAIWVTPAARNRTILRLAFVPELDEDAPFRTFLTHFFPEFSSNSAEGAIASVTNVQLIYRKTCGVTSTSPKKMTMTASRSLTLSATLTVLGPKPKDPAGERAKVSPTISLELVSTGAMNLHIITTDGKDSFTAVAKGWLSKLFPETGDEYASTLDTQGISSKVWFRRLTIQLARDKSLARASAAVEVQATLGRAKNGDDKPEETTNVPILFEAGYAKTAGKSEWSLSGDLWLQSVPDFPWEMYSDYEKFRHIDPVTPNPATSLKLTTLFSSLTGADNIPEPPPGIPDAITDAGFRVDRNSIFVHGTIMDCRPPAKDGRVAMLRWEELSVEASWNWTSKQVRVALVFRLHLEVPAEYEVPESCSSNSINGSIEYASGGKWTVAAGVRDINLGMLYAFFPDGAKDTLFELLKGIRIVDLSFVYKNGAGGTDLTCHGRLMLGEVVSLELTYECPANGKWKLSASLGVEVVTEPVTLGGIIDSLVDATDTSLPSVLPDFLADAVILGGDDLSPSFSLTVENDKDHGPRFSVKAGIAGLEVEFVQLMDKKAGTEPSGGSPAPLEKKGKVLRLFKAMLTKIPLPKEIPIVGTMEQPFDELGFVWVNQAVTSDQLSALDDRIDMPQGEGKAAGVAMAKGFHFLIVAKHKVVLDYPIGKARPGSDRPTDTGDEPPADADPPAPKPPGPGPEKPKDKMEPAQSNKGKYKKNMGSLDISNIGFQYDGKTLAILMDATIGLGPVTLDMMGFTLGLHFFKPNGEKTTLQNLGWEDAEVSIHGLGIQLWRPPLIIGGAFLHETSGDMDMYAGGLTVGFEPWLFQAAGFYGTVGGKDSAEQYKTLFAYTVLRGPLMNIGGFAEISGLTGAFGYNVDLTLPTLHNLTTFPLLNPPPFSDDQPPETPAQLVKKLLPRPGARGDFFNPQNGAMFVVAGLTVSAFQMLEVTALVAVQWAPRVQIALLGMAKCDVPSTKSPVKFAHVELGILATIDIDAGLMKLEAQLSPNSWILHRSCHLTGGFAMYYWFGGGRTDWVVSMGGYHSAYDAPAHYPRPERLRISWSIDSSLSVVGDAYFAITPKVCMGGLRLHAALSLGALSAWFDAAADFLIAYAPFHFDATVSVSVGVRFSMDIWFVTVNIAVEVAARLAIMGPPLHGIVHVDFWVFGFDVAFGDFSGGDGVAALQLAAFWDLVTQAESKSSEETGKAVAKPAHLFTCTKGLLTAKNKQEAKASDPWLVRSGLFQFTVECQFAIQAATVNGEGAKAPDPSRTTIDAIYARPMHLTQTVESTLEVDIGIPGAGRAKGWKATLAWKDMPEALWGKHNPAQTADQTNSLLSSSGGMVRLLMGLVIEAPEAKVSLDTMPQFLIEQAMRENIFDTGCEPPFPPHDEDKGVFAPIPRSPLTPEEENDPLKRKKPWDELKTAWEDTPTPRAAVDLWEGVFGWAPNSLSRDKPGKLIEHAHTLFLSAPLLGTKY